MLLSDLENLENMIDFIYPEEEIQFITNEDEFIETSLQLMYEYIHENPTLISEPDFHETMIEHIKELYLIQFQEDCFFNEEAEDELDDLIDISAELLYIHIIPPRSFPDTFVIDKPNIQIIEKKIKYLSDKPQPQQRTPEWYSFRHKLITASNAYKAFENQNTQNQLIYEKCQPLFIPVPLEDATPQLVCVTSTLHWGQKYEPLSVMIYEDTYKTKVGDFGCIQHETYSYLGASPDGINIDKTNMRYGRMLEIKNIVNREINGIPKIEYWIQMQLQMETCDLNECDFLETRFVEYENEELYNIEDSHVKGIIMYFSTPEGKPHYVYKPLHLTNIEEWEHQHMEECSKLDYTWIKNIYWKLDELSCVLVLRNKKWFQDNIEELGKVWSIIEKERITGSTHRAPNKRVKKAEIEVVEDGCFLNIDKENGKVAVIKQLSNDANIIVKVRTESIDDTKKNFIY